MGAFRSPGDAAISVGRGNGKSAFVAGLATAVVDPSGPLSGPRREVIAVASSFGQARIIFEDVIFFLRGSGHDLSDRKLWRLQDSANSATLEYRPTGARCRAIGSDPRRAHGLRPYLALLDEGAQFEAAKSERMISAVRTGLGKTPGSRLIALGTRPSDAQHWFSRMLAGGGAAYAQTHAAGPNDPKFQLRTWRKANPSLDHLPSLLAEIRSEAADARKDPAMMAAFDSLRLNLGTSDVTEQVLLAAGTWERIEGPGVRAGPYVLGLDLGGAAAMTAAAGYWPASGTLLSLAAFPCKPDLIERGLRDGVERSYCDMHKRGELLTLGQHVVDLEALLGVVLDKWGAPGAIVCDRWRVDLLREALDKMKFPPCDLVERGQGFKDGHADLDLFRRACLSGRVCPKPSLLLRSGMAQSRSVADPAGNEKLSKGSQNGRRLRARDDAVAAAILAVAEGSRRGSDKPSSGVYLGIVAA